MEQSLFDIERFFHRIPPDDGFTGSLRIGIEMVLKRAADQFAHKYFTRCLNST